MDKKEFYRDMMKIALPVTIQSLLQGVLSLIDQVMIGSLGSSSIAGVGLAANFVSLFVVTMSAIVTVAGIMVAQYKGSNNKKGISESFYCNLYFAGLVAIIAFLLAIIIPKQIMRLYSNDAATIGQSAIYLRVIALGFIPQTITLMMAAVLRNMDAAKNTMIASGIAVVTNTVLNYLFIFGIGIFPKMDVAGAGLATSISRIVELIIITIMFIQVKKENNLEFKPIFKFKPSFIKKNGEVLAPILLCEFFWCLGENAYAMIYGHIGTEACAAMTITYPLQTLVIGALSGVSASAGIMVGKSLGAAEDESAYDKSKQFVKVTVLLAACMSLFVALFAKYYVLLFNVSNDTRSITVGILRMYALVFIGKVVNMVLGGGILRSGGQTKYMMVIEIMSTWCLGVPLGYFAAYVLKLPIMYVYFILSLEEYVRVLLETYLFKSRKWMVNLAES